MEYSYDRQLPTSDLPPDGFNNIRRRWRTEGGENGKGGENYSYIIQQRINTNYFRQKCGIWPIKLYVFEGAEFISGVEITPESPTNELFVIQL